MINASRLLTGVMATMTVVITVMKLTVVSFNILLLVCLAIVQILVYIGRVILRFCGGSCGATVAMDWAFKSTFH